MKILLVGALSWNPERILSLRERGHELFGLWGRSMAWDQGPYPVLDGALTPVLREQAAQAIREHGVECVYGLYQSYPRRLWGPVQPTVEHDLDVWDLLRELLIERSRGRIDVPFVQHYGFDVSELDLDVVRALDGWIVCNEEKLAYWSRPVSEGGLGIDAFADRSRVTFLDGDRPKAEFMNDRFAPRLSDGDGGIHTVCVGRPVHVDVLAAARQGIHVHVYGNRFDEVYPALAEMLPARPSRRELALVERHLHVHSSLQTLGASRPAVWESKSRWVEEFSRYDAGWSYIGTPVPWEPLDDRAAIPNRLATYLLAGLPVISDPKPGHFRYDLLAGIGAALELGDAGYEGLRAQLEEEKATRAKSARARAARRRHSFDEGVPTLIGALEGARERYLARPHAERIRFAGGGSRLSLEAPPGMALPRTPDPPPPRGSLRQRLRRRRRERRRRRRQHARRRLAKRLARLAPATPSVVAAAERAPRARAPRPAAGTRRVAAFERFDEESRRCGLLADEAGVELVTFELHRVDRRRRADRRVFRTTALPWLRASLRLRRPLRVYRACLRSRDVWPGALRAVPEVVRRVRRGEVDELACFSTKELDFVPLLAEGLGVPFTEVLATRTQYLGEFAFEMLAVVPYAYWLHRQGRLERSVASEDTRCLYYFSEHHEERPGGRHYVPITEYPVGEPGASAFDQEAFPARLDRSRWTPPPYRERFRDGRFLWSRPTCVVCNKTSEENYLGAPRVNSIGTDLLLEIVGRLRARYQVVYDRPRSGDIVNDHQRVGETGDIEALRSRHPDVLTIQDLHARHPELGFNELQLRVFAGCRSFVSVVGGSSYLASWFGGTNVVYARGGWEVDCDAFDGWFGAFSGARVIAASTPEELLAAVDRELLGADGATSDA